MTWLYKLLSVFKPAPKGKMLQHNLNVYRASCTCSEVRPTDVIPIEVITNQSSFHILVHVFNTSLKMFTLYRTFIMLSLSYVITCEQFHANIK